MDIYQGKIAIVTGGASGIGAELCRGLARRGARVVVTDLDGDGAAKVAAELGEGARGERLDVTDAPAVRALIERTAATHGRLDYLFNNAGIAVFGEARDLGVEHWRKVIEVNLMGVVHGVAAAYPLMVRQGHGHIVNTASGYGLTPAAMLAPYGASKFAVVGLSEALRLEGLDLGVKVSVICPGFVRTPIMERSLSVGIDMAESLHKVPFGIITPDALARAALEGVARGKPIIMFPGYVRTLVWMYRTAPALFLRFAMKNLREIRALRRMDL